MANSDPRGMIGRIYEGYHKHCYIINIQDLGLVVSKKKIVFMFSHYKPMVDKYAPRHGQFRPQGHG